MWLAFFLTCIVTLLLYKLLKPSKPPFWEQYGVPQIHTSSLLDKLKMFTGKKIVSDFDHVAYQKLGSTGGKFCGVVELQQPYLLLRDLDLVKRILIRDFDYFTDRRYFECGDHQKWMNNTINNLKGDVWKGVRYSLSPTFTTGKIRRMTEHFDRVARDWVVHLKKEVEKNGGNAPLGINVQTEATNFTLDTIAAAVFGMNAGVVSDPDSVFGRMGKTLGNFSPKMIIKLLLSSTFPRVTKFLGMTILDVEALNFFETIMTQGMKARMEGSLKRNDLLQLIAEVRKGELKSEGEDELNRFEKEAQLTGQEGQGGSGSGAGKKSYLDDEDMAKAQLLAIFFSGFATTNNFIGFVLYMLALYPEVQEKLRKEVDSKLFAKGDGEKLDYDELNGLVYLDMVVCEVLRKYPAQPRLERKCTRDYHDNTENLRIPKGAMVSVPLLSIHNDKQYYNRPDEFYPEHFTPEEKAKRNPYAFMPFGSGPRNCIGMRFALVSSKAAIAHLVHSFRIEPTGKTPVPVQVKNCGFAQMIPDNLELGIRLLD